MPKVGVNDHCPCGSHKKYKKCCMMKDVKNKQEESESYFTGQDISTDKMIGVLDYYKKLFPKYCLIDITDNLNKDNYKTYLVKNYSNKTIMFAEKTENNEEFFNSKSDSLDNDIIIMFAGGYKVINSVNIGMYLDDIKAWIGYS